MLGRLFAAAVLVAVAALALRVPRLGVSIAPLIVAAVSGLAAPALGAAWPARRRAGRDAATR